MEGRKAERRIKVASTWDGLTQLAVLSICFVIGALGGFFLSAVIGERQELVIYLQRYFQLVGTGVWRTPSLFASAWELFRWPLIAALLGMTALGAVGIPLLLAVRSFMLSFTVATFSRLFGLSGLAIAAAIFCLTILIAVPVLFVISQAAFRQSLAQLSGATPSASVWSRRMKLQLPCLSLLILGVALQQTIMPALLTTVCARLFVL